MEISVIVCTYNRPHDVDMFMNSLDAQTRQPDELVVVDASNNDETKKNIEMKMTVARYGIRYVHSARGLTKQRNIGVSRSQGEYLFFFDDDIVLDPCCIAVVYDTFKKFAGMGIGGVTGRIINIDYHEKSMESLFKKIFFLTDQGIGKVKYSGFPSHRVDHNPSFVEVAQGGTTAYIRDVFSRYSFDERLEEYAYMEDVDFSYRVGRKYKLFYNPNAKMQHFATTFKTADSRWLRRMMIQNCIYLFKKNMPHDFPHIGAFCMSLAGLFLYNLLFAKDLRACRGIMEGILNRPIQNPSRETR